MKKTRTYTLITILILIILMITSCGGDDATATPDPDQAVSSNDTPAPTPTEKPIPSEPVTGEAKVDSVQIVILESFPVKVNAIARGEFPNGCTSIDEISTEHTGNTFEITITTIRPGDAMCTEALVPFEETIPLDVLDLEAGSYTVTVNGISGSFTLDVDNRIQEEPTPEPTATPEPSLASLSGRVWHDLCAIAGGEGDEEAVPSDGCIATADGESFQGNGLLDANEPGIEGILVALGEGECPGTELDTATTDENGEYTFSNLPAGSYCVSIDALLEQNTAILVPGGWTYPGTDEDNTTVSLDEGDNLTDVNFGWDYQFLPLPEVDPDSCTNSIEFVEDLSVPDDTVFGPGEEFTKSWRLRNIGTCPWTTEYSLTFVGGDGIPGPESLPLPSPVAPGQTADLSVTLTTPDAVGTYRDNWQLSNANGVTFGINGLIEEAFWVQIVVAEAQPTPSPNSATIGGVVWSDTCFLQTNGNYSSGCVETEDGSGIYIGNGTLNNNERRISGISVTLSQGPCPTEGAVVPADIIGTTTTDEDGLYRFSNLDGGDYCVSINAFNPENVDTLIPGDWTWPAPGVGLYNLVLDPGEQLLDIDFGWDHADD